MVLYISFHRRKMFQCRCYVNYELSKIQPQRVFIWNTQRDKIQFHDKAWPHIFGLYKELMLNHEMGVSRWTFFVGKTFCCMRERITVAASFHWSQTSPSRKSLLAWRTRSFKLKKRINKVSEQLLGFRILIVLLTYSKSVTYLESFY